MMIKIQNPPKITLELKLLHRNFHWNFFSKGVVLEINSIFTFLKKIGLMLTFLASKSTANSSS